ncbi:MAG: RNA polymerase sigma factor [Thermoguttaceae bacterium]
MPTPSAKTLEGDPSRPPPARRDEDLLAIYARTGSGEAFEELVRRYQREIFSYLYRFLGDAQLAEDAAQATFLRLHLKCRQFEQGRGLRPWLHAIANNQAVDLLRRNRRHKAVSLSTPVRDAGADEQRRPLGDLLQTKDAGVVAGLESVEDRQRTRLAMDKIPAKLRQVLLLVVYQGLKQREAATLLGIARGTVKSRMDKALRSLREAFLRHYKDNPGISRNFSPGGCV